MSAIAATCVAPSVPARDARHLQLPVPPQASRQLVLAVEFRSRDGRSWNGGTTVAEAIEWARECFPEGMIWYAASWNDL